MFMHHGITVAGRLSWGQPVGSGKSTILAAVVGEAEVYSGECRLAAQRVAYLPQAPWVKNGSVLENVTMSSAGTARSVETGSCRQSRQAGEAGLDGELLEAVLAQCDLGQDLQQVCSLATRA